MCKLALIRTCALGLLLATVALSTTFIKASAQDEGFLFPYQGKTFFWTNGAGIGECHTDGYGEYYAGVAGPCSVDFTHYSSGEKVNCGEPAMAPVSGEFVNLGRDKLGNTLGLLKGSRYWVLFLHGDFVPSGYLQQGNIFGYENTHGQSNACHWHMDVLDITAGQWVNPTNMQLLGTLPSGAGLSDVTADAEMIKVLQSITIHTSSIEVPDDSTPVPDPAQDTASSDPTPDQAPAQQPQQPLSQEKANNAFIMTWAVVIGLLIGSGMLGWGDHSQKQGGFLILIIASAAIFWLSSQKFQPVWKLSQLGQSSPVPAETTESSSTEVSPDDVPQSEEVVETSVILHGLPKLDGGSPRLPPANGSCTINPRWPQAVQTYCVWITQYTILVGDNNSDWSASKVWQESLGNPKALSRSCAAGLIQVMPSDGKGFIRTNAEGKQYFECDLTNGTAEAYQQYYANGSGGYYFQNRPTIQQLWDPEFNLQYGLAYQGGLIKNHGSVWEADLYYGGPAYGDLYRGAIKNHYDCVVNLKTESCRSDLAKNLQP